MMREIIEIHYSSDDETISKAQAQQEELYKEYIDQCKLSKEPPKLGDLNPYWFSEELINSIPEDEYQGLCAAYKKKEWKNPKLWLGIGILILVPLIYVFYVMYLFKSS